jgi:hypothetical protein
MTHAGLSKPLPLYSTKSGRPCGCPLFFFFLPEMFGSFRNSLYICSEVNIVKENTDMATITISNAAYNNAKLFADKQNMGVDEFIVTLINKLTYPTKDKKKFNLLPMEQMEPALQEIINMSRKETSDADGVNVEQERMEYYKEKYSL